MADDEAKLKDYDPYAEMVQQKAPELFCDCCGFYPLEPVHDILCVRAVTCRPSAVKAVRLRPKLRAKKPLRVGIYAGAFDPVHAGHVAFALQATELARLDQVIFMPERRPRAKPSVEHYAHRMAMIKSALALHPKLAVMEVVDRQFSVWRTLPMLQALFPQAQLSLLVGSDAVVAIPDWQYADRLLQVCELIVGLRADCCQEDVTRLIENWKVQPKTTIVTSYAPDVTSSKVRQAIRTRRHTNGLLSSVREYARSEWLYVSPGYGSL